MRVQSIAYIIFTRSHHALDIVQVSKSLNSDTILSRPPDACEAPRSIGWRHVDFPYPFSFFFLFVYGSETCIFIFGPIENQYWIHLFKIHVHIGRETVLVISFIYTYLFKRPRKFWSGLDNIKSVVLITYHDIIYLKVYIFQHVLQNVILSLYSTCLPLFPKILLETMFLSTFA